MQKDKGKLRYSTLLEVEISSVGWILTKATAHCFASVMLDDIDIAH